MQTQRAQRNPWTKGEKFILAAILLTVVLAAFGTFWWRQINTTPVVSVPTPTMPVQNAFDNFNAAASTEVQKNSVDYAIATFHPPHPAPGSLDRVYSAQEKAALVQSNAGTLRTLRQGLAIPYQNPPLRSFMSGMPYYAKFRGLARLLTLEGQVREGRGDWDGAVNSHLDAVELGEKIPHGGPLIGMLVGVACEAIGRRPVWSEINHLNAAQARAAIHRLEVIQKEQLPLADTLQEEEWSTQASLMELFHHPTWRGDLAAEMMGDGEGSDADLTLSQKTRLRFASKKSIMDDYTAAMEEYVRAARLPYTSPAPAAPSDPIVQEIISVYPKLRLKSSDNQTQDVLLLTMLALHTYRLEHGSYPPTLAALTPRYLARVPDDPFTSSGPLRYKRQGGKYVLYSVGPDGRDDGGKPIFDATKPAPQPGEHDPRYYVMPDSQGDIVAGVNF